MTNVDVDRKNRSIITEREFNLLRAEARANSFDFLALRNEALLCGLRLFGKRRAEFGYSKVSPGLLRSDVWVDEVNINFNFKLLKKHQARLPEKIKRVPLDDPLAAPILNYLEYLDGLGTPVKYFLPSAKNVFGNYMIQYDKCLPSRCVYDVVRELGDSCGVVVWPHLFRETAGGSEIIKDPTVYGMAKVMNRIDVTERTAWAYMDRHVMSVIRSTKDDEKV